MASNINCSPDLTAHPYFLYSEGSITKMPSGKYRVRLEVSPSPLGKRQWLTAVVGTQKEATSKLQEFQRQKKTEDMVEKLKESFSDFIEPYLTYKASEGLLPSTLYRIRQTLKETGDKKVIPYFVEATNDEDFGVRKVAVRSLGELQAEEELDAIAKCLEDEDWGVRLAAIQALGDIATDDSIKLIKDARKAESDKDFKKSCNKAIKKAQKRQKAKASGEEVVSLIPMSTLKEMEKTNVQKAIKGYEGYVESRQAKDAPYKRLCILYRKANDYDSEVRVLKTACEVFADNDKKLSYFQKRLDKLQ